MTTRSFILTVICCGRVTTSALAGSPAPDPAMAALPYRVLPNFPALPMEPLPKSLGWL
ncbi:MAG: hypothetical protein ACREIF_01675 [Chthoniobacterales bacterium]